MDAFEPDVETGCCPAVAVAVAVYWPLMASVTWAVERIVVVVVPYVAEVVLTAHCSWHSGSDRPLLDHHCWVLP